MIKWSSHKMNFSNLREKLVQKLRFRWNQQILLSTLFSLCRSSHWFVYRISFLRSHAGRCFLSEELRSSSVSSEKLETSWTELRELETPSSIFCFKVSLPFECDGQMRKPHLRFKRQTDGSFPLILEKRYKRRRPTIIGKSLSLSKHNVKKRCVEFGFGIY